MNKVPRTRKYLPAAFTIEVKMEQISLSLTVCLSIFKENCLH